MRIHIATDHAGLEFSTQLQHHLAEAGHDVVDHGPIEYDALDDYPAFCINAAQAVVLDQAAGIDALGVVFGGSGNGEQIAANKVRGARAALVWNLSTAKLARDHNDANVISIGARQHPVEDVIAFIRAEKGTGPYRVMNPELFEPVVNEDTGEEETFEGWVDPNYAPEPGSTPFPACWTDEFTAASASPGAGGSPTWKAKAPRARIPCAAFPDPWTGCARTWNACWNRPWWECSVGTERSPAVTRNVPRVPAWPTAPSWK